VTKDVTSFFFLFTPKPVISSHVSFCDKLRPSAADLHATGFPRECVGLERSALASFKNCSELRVQPTPDSFYVTGCLFRVHLWSSLLYSLLLYSHTHTLGIEPVTGFLSSCESWMIDSFPKESKPNPENLQLKECIWQLRCLFTSDGLK
jgi:hypothetical protein